MEISIQEACKLLKEGKTLLYPTDTIWGLGCDATSEAAVEKIYDIKRRPKEKHLIILVSHEAMLERYVKTIPDVAWDILEASTTPVTIVYPQGVNLAPNLTEQDGSIAIRLVSEGFCHDLIKRYNRPLVSTSANFSGEPAPVTFEEIDEEITKQVDFIVGRGETMLTGIPSSVIKLGVNGEVKIIRE